MGENWTECMNYRSTSLLSVVGRIYAEVLVDRIPRVTEGLVAAEQEGLRSGKGFMDHTLTLKQMGEKARGKKMRVYVGLMDLEKVKALRLHGGRE